jgi:hypothetical protein
MKEKQKKMIDRYIYAGVAGVDWGSTPIHLHTFFTDGEVCDTQGGVLPKTVPAYPQNGQNRPMRAGIIKNDCGYTLAGVDLTEEAEIRTKKSSPTCSPF